MKLNENLYKIVSQADDSKSYTIEFIPESIIYRAHFPEQPITPGVCIIQIATELLSLCLHKEYELSSISNAKFLAVINPTKTPQVSYIFKKIEEIEDTTKLKVSAIVAFGDITYTKLSLVYSKK